MAYVGLLDLLNSAIVQWYSMCMSLLIELWMSFMQETEAKFWAGSPASGTAVASASKTREVHYTRSSAGEAWAKRWNRHIAG